MTLTASSKNDVALRQKLEVVGIEVHEVHQQYQAEATERHQFLDKLEQYLSVLQKGTAQYLQLANEAHIRSEARLSDVTESLASDLSSASYDGTSKATLDSETHDTDNPASIDSGSVEGGPSHEDSGYNTAEPTVSSLSLDSTRMQWRCAYIQEKKLLADTQYSLQSAVKEAFARFISSHREDHSILEVMDQVNNMPKRMGQANNMSELVEQAQAGLVKGRSKKARRYDRVSLRLSAILEGTSPLLNTAPAVMSLALGALDALFSATVPLIVRLSKLR